MRPATIAAAILIALAGCRDEPAVLPPAEAPATPAAEIDGLPAGRELIADGGFEAPGPGPWHENNWARNQAEFVRDHDRPWQGATCQRMRLLRIDHEPALELVQPLRGVKPGDVLLVRLALRGTANGRPVTVRVRRWAKPYTSIAALEVPVTEDWRTTAFPVAVPARFDVSDIACFVDLHDESPIWVDGVSVTVLPPVDPRPLRTGNLIANGSFEVGTAGWTATFRDAVGLERVSTARDLITPADWSAEPASDAPDGRRILRFSVHDGGQAMVDSGYVAYRHGHPLHLELGLRAPAAGAKARIAIGHGSSPATVAWLASREIAAAAPGWSRIAIDCPSAGPSATGAFVEVSTAVPGDWAIDAVRLEQAPGGADPLTLGCRMPDAPPGRIYRGAEVPWLEVAAAGAPAGTLPARLRIEDAWDRTVADLPLAIAVAPDGRGLARLELPHDRFGAFRCAVEVAGRLATEQLYTVVPELPRPDGTGRSFFGGHFAFDAYSLDLAERGGFRWLRMMSQQLDTNWQAVEPETGRWTIRTTAVERAVARGFSVLGNLNSPPEWASLKTGDKPYRWWHARLPRDWDEYGAYVRRTVAAFPGIAAWEVGNEMESDYLIVPPEMDKPAAYTDLVRRTRALVEAVAPGARIAGLGVACPDRPFWRTCLGLGIARELDAMAFHFYYEDLDPLEKHPDFTAALDAMRAGGSRSGRPLELWMGEGGMWLDRSPSRLRLLGIPSGGTTDLDAAHAIVRNAAAFKALGLAHSFHYAGATSPAGSGNVVWRSECNGLFDYDGSARPALAAHAAMVWLLDDAEPLGAASVAVGPAQVRLARFDHPRRGRITVAWSRTPLSAAAVPGLLDGIREVRDLMGNPLPGEPMLSACPVYLIAPR